MKNEQEFFDDVALIAKKIFNILVGKFGEDKELKTFPKILWILVEIVVFVLLCKAWTWIVDFINYVVWG